MAYIKIDIRQLSQLEAQLAQLPNRIAAASSTTSSVRSGLDWDVACEEAIDARLRQIAQTLERCQSRMKQTAAFAAQAAAEYQQTEEQCAQDEAAAKAALRAKGEALIQQAQERTTQNAIDHAISKYDTVASYLSDAAKTGGSFLTRLSGVGYDLASFAWVDAAKLLIPGSEAVDTIRREAIQKAYATMIQASTSEPLDYDAIDTRISIFLTGFDAGGNAAILAYRASDTAADNFSLTSSALSILHETCIDYAQYQAWNDTQKQVFAATLSSCSENLQLLNDLKTAFPEDTILVTYCDDMISGIEDFLNGKGLPDAVNSLQVAGSFTQNVLEACIDEYLPDVVVNGILGKMPGAGIVTTVGSLAGDVTELAFGTGTTAESFDQVNILYANINASIDAYTTASSNGTLSPAAQRFQELNILNQKMAALDLTTDLNQKFGVKDSDLVEGVDSMKDMLERSYEVLAP